MTDDIERIGALEERYVLDVLASGFRSSSGARYMKRLEAAAAERFGSRFAISMVNGTATLHASLEAAGVGPGDEVIVPPLTMSATAFAVLQTGATPVFADVDPSTFQIDPDSVRARIGPATKAVITVALYGLSPDMDAIMALASDHRLFVLEDDAECFLGEYKGRLVGTLGHAASLSFQSSKHLTAGEGGLVLTDDEELANRIRQVGSLGYAGVSSSVAKISKADIQDPNYDRHVSMGWNYRMSELCSAVALAQVERIDELVRRRQDVAGLFGAVVGDSPLLRPQHVGEEYVHSYWTYVAVIEDEGVTFRDFRDEFVGRGGDGIYAAWKLSYLEPMFSTPNLLGRERFVSADRLSEYKVGLCPVAESLQPRLLQFKTNYWTWSDAERQAEVLADTIAHFR